VLDVVAVGGVASGREAYVAHLTGAQAIQVGSALMKEGVTALNRIDRELDSILADNHQLQVKDVIGSLGFEH
jgi:dihydroorotate dehydrogenase (fumarate)